MDVEALNDRLAREHPIDDYYTRSPWPIRFVERRRLAIIRSFMGEVDWLESPRSARAAVTFSACSRGRG